MLKLNELLDIELPRRGDEDYQRVMSIQKDAAVSVLGAGLKADENRFRRRNSNVLNDLFAQLQRDKILTIEGEVDQVFAG